MSSQWPPYIKSKALVEPGVTCGWCQQRVPDLSHIVECRRDKGESARMRLVSQLSSWVGETLRERSVFMVSLDHLPGDAINVLLDLGEYAQEHYANVSISMGNAAPF